MSLATEQREGEAIRLNQVFMVVLTPDGVILPGIEGKTDLICDLPRLLLLERLARGDAPRLDVLVDDVAATTGLATADLVGFVDELIDRDLARAADSPQAASGGWAAAESPAASASYDPAQPLVMPTPLILALAAEGFEQLDHDGRALLRLSARELGAAVVFCKPVSYEQAYEMHREQSGAQAALDTAEFDSVVVRLFDARLLRQFDPADLSLGRGFDRTREDYRREMRGRRAVREVMDQVMAEFDEIEAERRARTGTKRVKVFPVHSIPTDWRNPPLSLGLIMAYAKDYEGGRLEEHFDFRPDWMIDQARVDHYGDEPGIYLFSSYIWSSANNLELSAQVKQRNPGSVTIHGGPNVPKYEIDVRAYFAQHPHVDITVRGEGEITTAELLSVLIDRLGDGPVDLSVLEDVPGLCYRDGDDVVITADRDRMPDLDLLPSPYLTGLFDSYVKGWEKVAEAGAKGTDGWAYKLPVVVLETNRGCPYGCTFCDWGSATLSRIRKYSIERIFDEIEWCATHKVDTIGLADANFGIFERDVDITTKVAESKLEYGYPKQFGTNYAKNSVKHLKQIVEELARADILSFGLLSLQSMDPETLDTIQRSNIKIERYEDLAAEFQKARLPLYVDLMVGLPGQTLASFRNDLQECVNREVHAKVFQTQLLVNSPMNEPSYREKHGIVQTPGELVVQSASFSRNDYEAMLRSRRVFYLLEKFGILRHVARYVRQETDIREVDFYDELWDAARAAPQRWPMLDFTLNALHRYMVPPVSWRIFLDEVHDYLTEVMGLVDDDALATVLTVQHALLPDRRRQFPFSIDLPHDYEAWHAAMIEAKQSGHLADWPTVAPPLRSFGPGTFTVEDSRKVCTYEMGRHAEINPWDAWDLDSVVSRPVALQN